MFISDSVPVSTGMDLTCKLWTQFGSLVNVIPLPRSVVNGESRTVVTHEWNNTTRVGGLGLGHHAFVLCCCNGSVTALAYDSFKVLNKVSLHEGCSLVYVFLCYCF